MMRVIVLLSLIGYSVCSPPVSKSREEIEAFRDALEKSRIDDGVLLESRILANPKAYNWENSGKFEGDILLDDDQIDTLVSEYAGVDSSSRTALVVANTRWPGNVMIYEFGVNEFTNAERDRILNAMAWVEHFSCVRFRRRTNERNFVRITGRATGCYAHVGFSSTRGVHTLNLARQGCLWHAIILHELLHNLGFYHMHSAYERYNYVRINWANIQQGYAFAFNRMARNRVSLLSLPYEYGSNMHYSTHAFSANGRPTITATRSFQGVMGNDHSVTHWDWLRLRRHYNCPGAWNERDIQELKEEVERTRPLMIDTPLPIEDINDETTL
ncbi:high choriolytic enzyme 1-like [Bicyclus anynana]|uniref:Metalloendopeptidase n=1 Tax=Bicyclus anynana TaxID=110368 RepID=A0ABM3M7V9_BICAN|nr:high choriolytic enzyme 1-like [Bicyclus anynana]